MKLARAFNLLLLAGASFPWCQAGTLRRAPNGGADAREQGDGEAIIEEAMKPSIFEGRDPKHVFDDYHATGGYRRLEGDAMIRTPSPEELSAMIMEEIKTELDANGTATQEDVIARVTEMIIGQYGDQIDADAALEPNVTVVPDDPAFQDVEEAIAVANGLDRCEEPGRQGCEDEDLERGQKVRSFLRHKIIQKREAGEDINLEELYELLKNEIGIEPEVAEELIENDEDIKAYLIYKFHDAEETVAKKKVQGITQGVEHVVVAGENNMTDFDALVESHTGLDEDELELALEAMDPEQADQLLKALQKPHEDLLAQVAQARLNHTTTEENFVEDVDGQGRRLMRFVRSANSGPSFQEQADGIRADLQRRRRRRLLPKDTGDFQARLSDHIDHLEEHVRRLGEMACEAGTTEARCVADHLGELTEGVRNKTAHIGDQIAPLSNLLGEVSMGQATMDDIELMARLTLTAVKVATKIPTVGSLFIPVKIGMDPVHDVLAQVDEKATTFETSIGSVWQNSIGRVEDIITSFDSGAIAYTTSGAELVATFQETMCIPGLLHGLIGVDVLGGIETAIKLVKDYIVQLFDALEALGNALQSDVWSRASKTLGDIVSALDPVERFFRPFEPLIDMITTEITLPWFNPPVAQKKLGPSSCFQGFSRTGGRKCWEEDSFDWQKVKLSLPRKMMKTCQSGAMTDHWSSGCNNDIYTRRTEPLKTRCWCTGYGKRGKCKLFHWKCATGCPSGWKVGSWALFTCFEPCAPGYTAFMGKCRKTHCPSGYGTSLDKVKCTRTTRRDRSQHEAFCEYNIPAGRSTSVDIFGACWQSCNHDETKVLGLCFKRGPLRLSLEVIFEALAKILDFISGLPLVKQIMDGIEAGVRFILNPVINKISDFIADAISLPNFPSIDLDLLHLSAFDNLDLNLPSAPDFSQLANLPEKIVENLGAKLPAPINEIANCGTNMTCMLPSIGIPDVSEMVDSVGELFQSFDGVGDKFLGLVESFNCTKWGEKVIPVVDLIDKLGFTPLGETCDFSIPYCEEFDMTSINESVNDISSLLDADKISNLTAQLDAEDTRRRLDADSDDDSQRDKFFGLIGFGYLMGLTGDTNSLSGRRKTDLRILGLPKKLSGLSKKPKQPVGLHFRLAPKAYFDLGIMRENGKWKLGIEVGGKVEVKFVHTKGAKQLWREARSLAHDLQPGADKTNPDETQYWESDLGGDCFKEIGGAYHFAPIAEDAEACDKYMREAAALAKATPPPTCKEEEMILKTISNDYPDQVAHATTCIQHWFGVHTKIEKLTKKFIQKRKAKKTKYMSKYSKSRENFQKLRVKTEWLTMGGALVDGLLMGVSLQAKDYVTKTKLGPTFLFDSKTGALAKWHLGELQLAQLLIFSRIAFLSAKEKMVGDYERIEEAATKKASWKKEIQSTLSDVSGGIVLHLQYSKIFGLWK